MALSTLDPRTALIIVDLQQGVVSLPTVHLAGDIVEGARTLAEAFRRRGLPVVIVRVAGAPPGRTERPSNVASLPPGWADLVPDLVQPGHHLVTKRTWGAFTNTDLEGHLKREGVTQVVIAGIATSIGVESTARHARELGFNVALAVDAMTDTDAQAHVNSVERIFPRLGETGTIREILALLNGRD